MGAAGINTIATLLIAFLRPTLAGMICGRDNVREGASPRRRVWANESSSPTSWR